MHMSRDSRLRLLMLATTCLLPALVTSFVPLRTSLPSAAHPAPHSGKARTIASLPASATTSLSLDPKSLGMPSTNQP